jgi:hypothetical protein
MSYIVAQDRHQQSPPEKHRRWSNHLQLQGLSQWRHEEGDDAVIGRIPAQILSAHPAAWLHEDSSLWSPEQLQEATTESAASEARHRQTPNRTR